jgi:hypothetical protein
MTHTAATPSGQEHMVRHYPKLGQDIKIFFKFFIRRIIYSNNYDFVPLPLPLPSRYRFWVIVTHRYSPLPLLTVFLEI